MILDVFNVRALEKAIVFIAGEEAAADILDLYHAFAEVEEEIVNEIEDETAEAYEDGFEDGYETARPLKPDVIYLGDMTIDEADVFGDDEMTAVAAAAQALYDEENADA